MRTLLVVAGVAIVAFVLAYFEPQKRFIDDRVSEAAPAAAGQTLSSAAFRSYEHATAGRARVIASPDGRRYVRFEGFSTSNGPALKVYLSAAPATGPGDSFDDRFVDLGDLKGNIGAQNYAIARDVRLDAYRSVVVWCKRFSVPFAAAAL
jgi:Electron transfer DM13